MPRGRIVHVYLVTFLIPVSALLLGVFVLGERVDWTLFLGTRADRSVSTRADRSVSTRADRSVSMALIFAGLVAVDGRLIRFFSILRRPRLQ